MKYNVLLIEAESGLVTEIVHSHEIPKGDSEGWTVQWNSTEKGDTVAVKWPQRVPIPHHWFDNTPNREPIKLCDPNGRLCAAAVKQDGAA